MQVLLTEEQIQERIAELALEMNRLYRKDPITIVGVLTGSIIFMADLIRKLNMPIQLGLIQASSYRGAVTEPSTLEVQRTLLPELAGRNILVIDDILDTGQTLGHLLGYLRTLEPTSLRAAVLLRKKGRQQISIEPEFTGFTIPDSFVVGYGLDYNGEFRQLPHIAILDVDEA